MRRLILAAAMSGATLAAGYGIASAQVAIEIPGASVYFGPNYYDDDYYDYRDRRVYRYDDDERHDDDYHATKQRERRNDFAMCGRYSYWDGNACQLGRRP